MEKYNFKALRYSSLNINEKINAKNDFSKFLKSQKSKFGSNIMIKENILCVIY